MWFFKKKSALLNVPEQIREEARRKGKINLLSPAQIEKVISENKDLDVLDQELKAQMNCPDIDYLIKVLVPQRLRRTARKPIPIEDIITGVVCGDIIGSKLEFTEHDYAEAKTMTLPPRKSFHTDDTVLTKATYAAIQQNPENPNFRQAYIDAYHKEKGAGYGGSFVAWAENQHMFYTETMEARPRDNTVGYHSYANGCAMRIAPIPSYYDDLLTATKHAIASCMTTHDHVESVKATIVLTVCMWMALHGYEKHEIFEYCAQAYETSEDLFCRHSHFDMHTNLNDISNEISKRSLFSNYAVPFAIKCFTETDNYEACMREILSHYGDTDTICAIAGGLCVAFYGTTGMNTQSIIDADWHKI